MDRRGFCPPDIYSESFSDPNRPSGLISDSVENWTCGMECFCHGRCSATTSTLCKSQSYLDASWTCQWCIPANQWPELGIPVLWLSSMNMDMGDATT